MQTTWMKRAAAIGVALAVSVTGLATTASANDGPSSPLTDVSKPPTGTYEGGHKWSPRPDDVKINGLNVHHHATTTDAGIRRLIKSNEPASANYIIKDDGTLIKSVPEKYRAWTTSGEKNDDDKITVEIQNHTGAPKWKISKQAMQTLVRLYADLSVRYDFPADRKHIHGHQEYGVATACPGPYLLPRLGNIAKRAAAEVKRIEAREKAEKEAAAKKAAEKKKAAELAAAEKKKKKKAAAEVQPATSKKTRKEAVGWAKKSRNGFGGLCLQFVRLAYGVGPKYPSAISAWKNAKHKEKTTDASDIPVGAPVYFDKPSSEYGHIAVYVGNGKIATTHASTNKTGVDKISTWTGAYGYTMLGWSKDVNGVLVSGGSK